MSSTAEPAEGTIILPKRAPLWAAVGVVGSLIVGGATQLIGGASYVAKIDSRFEGLAENDARITKRSDERYAAVVDRLASLERDRNDTSGRLIRLEEQLRMSVDLLREIRESMRASPRR